MHNLTRHLQRILSKQAPPGAHILLAVSGGPDSVALLLGLREVREACELTLSAAHLNHHLRGQESDEDADWVAELCRRLGLPLVVGDKDVARIAKSRGRGLEETARRERYRFLEEIASQRGCTHIAVAHTADDQVETILHHILRGTGIAGLRGMPSRRLLASEIELIRPLLEISREDVEKYLAEQGQQTRHDSSNTDPAFTRNRIRRLLLPLLRREFNLQAEDALLRLGKQATEIQELLEILARRLLQRAVRDRAGSICRLSCRELATEPRHLIRECLRLLWSEQGWPRKSMGTVEWDRLAGLVCDEGTATLPGDIQACRRGDLLILRRRQQ